MDTEARRLKNRVRQQRYRARKREEKAKRDENVFQGNHSTRFERKSLPEECSVLAPPAVANGHAASELDVGSVNMQMNAQTIIPQDCNDNFGKESTRVSASATLNAQNSREDAASHQVREIPMQQQTIVQSFELNVHGDTDMTHNHMSCSQNVIFIQPLARVEAGYHLGGCTKRTHDLMARRLKNRERQRRYRARKRLEADTKNAYLTTEPNVLPIEPPESAVIVKFEARVHSHRKWKKDAREFHASGIQESTSLGDHTASPTNDHQPNSSPHASGIPESASVRDQPPAPSLANEHQPKCSPHAPQIPKSTSIGDLASASSLSSEHQPNSPSLEAETPNSISLADTSAAPNITNDHQPSSLPHEPETPKGMSVSDISSAPSLTNEDQPNSLPHEPEITNIISVANISFSPSVSNEHQPNSSPTNLQGFHDPMQVKAEAPPGRGFQSEHPVNPDDNGDNDTMQDGRHWKVDARNKMEEESTV